MKFEKLLAVVFVAGVVCAVQFAKASTLYAVGLWSPDMTAHLYTIDPSTATATNIGSTGLHNLTGIAFAADGTLYGTTADAPIES